MNALTQATDFNDTESVVELVENVNHRLHSDFRFDQPKEDSLTPMGYTNQVYPVSETDFKTKYLFPKRLCLHTCSSRGDRGGFGYYDIDDARDLRILLNHVFSHDPDLALGTPLRVALSRRRRHFSVPRKRPFRV